MLKLNFHRFAVCLLVVLLSVLCVALLLLGAGWLYVFLFTEYRSHLWKWGVAAGSVALLLGVSGIAAMCRVLRTSDQ